MTIAIWYRLSPKPWIDDSGSYKDFMNIIFTKGPGPIYKHRVMPKGRMISRLLYIFPGNNHYNNKNYKEYSAKESVAIGCKW